MASFFILPTCVGAFTYATTYYYKYFGKNTVVLEVDKDNLNSFKLHKNGFHYVDPKNHLLYFNRYQNEYIQSGYQMRTNDNKLIKVKYHINYWVV